MMKLSKLFVSGLPFFLIAPSKNALFMMCVYQIRPVVVMLVQSEQLRIRITRKPFNWARHLGAFCYAFP
jgi:hypothetical protein